jgi:hypothetical protein
MTFEEGYHSSTFLMTVNSRLRSRGVSFSDHEYVEFTLDLLQLTRVSPPRYQQKKVHALRSMIGIFYGVRMTAQGIALRASRGVNLSAAPRQ